MIPGPDISSYLAIPELAKRELTYQLKIDGEPVERMVGLSYEADGPALVLDCTLPFRVPRSIEGKDITVDLRLGPGTYRTFTGEALRPDGKSFQAASGSFWDPIINEDTSYQEAAPRSVAYGLLVNTGNYAGINIPEPETPVFTRTLDEEYPWITNVKEILGALEEEAQLQILDDGRNVANGFLTPSLETPGDPLFNWTTDGGRAQLRSFSHSARFTERYAYVVVYRTLESGTVERLARAGVDNQYGNPSENQVLAIEVSDADSAVTDIYQRAREQAYNEATRRSHAEEEGDMESVLIDPRVERGDSGVITEVERAEDGIYTGVYAVRIVGFSHTLVEDGNDIKEASYSHIAQVLSETFTEIRDEHVNANGSAGVVPGVFSETNLLYPGTELYPDTLVFPQGSQS